MDIQRYTETPQVGALFVKSPTASDFLAVGQLKNEKSATASHKFENVRVRPCRHGQSTLRLHLYAPTARQNHPRKVPIGRNREPF